MNERNEKIEYNNCPEFPHFGARYPDARCIDGYLWDLDSNNDEGLFTHGGDDPCPFCNTESYLEYAVDELNGVTKEQVLKYIENLKARYGYKQNHVTK